MRRYRQIQRVPWTAKKIMYWALEETDAKLRSGSKGSLDTTYMKVETAWRKRSPTTHCQEKEEKENPKSLASGTEHHGPPQARLTDAASAGASTAETDCPQCGQLSD